MASFTHLLHLAFTLTPDLAHLETDQLPQRIHIRRERLPYLPDDLASLRAGHGADEAGCLLCPRDRLAGLVDCCLEDNVSDPHATSAMSICPIQPQPNVPPEAEREGEEVR
jgi:hypothetical protein